MSLCDSPQRPRLQTVTEQLSHLLSNTNNNNKAKNTSEKQVFTKNESDGNS